MWIYLLRLALLTTVVGASVSYSITGRILTDALFGVAAALAVIGLEIYMRAVPPRKVMGAFIGAVAGIVLALLASASLSRVAMSPSSQALLQALAFLFLVYLGLVLGSTRGEWFDPLPLAGSIRTSSAPQRTNKILDTSVIIDGRVADICETGFMDGTLVIPQFVLRELQQVADSADSLKRNRGRRGLDILQKIQKMGGLDVSISEVDFPEVKEVDLKIIELAKSMSGKIVTNDFNLNKVAHLRGVEVLNINELANALKPVVLPGEFMRVFILKEGKEYNQGVAYLDDGTMVVVDNARKWIGKNVDITVTSVLQTTAGKMIFGKTIESAAGASPAPAPAVTANDTAAKKRPV